MTAAGLRLPLRDRLRLDRDGAVIRHGRFEAVVGAAERPRRGGHSPTPEDALRAVMDLDPTEALVTKRRSVVDEPNWSIGCGLGLETSLR
jgi:hypothetical protein